MIACASHLSFLEVILVFIVAQIFVPSMVHDNILWGGVRHLMLLVREAGESMCA